MQKPTKICFIGLKNLPVLAREFNKHGIGGEEVQHTLLARALVRRGYEVSMVVADYGQKDGAEWDGIKTYKAYNPTDGWPGIRFFVPRLTGLWSAMKRADADIYYISCASFRVGVCAMFANVHRRKLVFRIASDMDCEPEKLLIEHRYNYWRDRQFYEYGLRHSHAILAQSAHQQETLIRNYGLPGRYAAMMVDAVTSILPFSDRPTSALWVSNIRQLKRPDLLLDLAVALPKLSVHMVGGPIPDSALLYEEIRQRASTITNMVFHGQIPYHDVNDYFARSRVFVNTSEIEGFPNSFLQSWARGTPVVSFFDPDGIIKKEGLGYAVKDLAHMRDAVAGLCAEPAHWQEVSDRCVAFMLKRFDESKILSVYVDVFEN
jgi:glycosyltransferase involved in cell wall biosynthesis